MNVDVMIWILIVAIVVVVLGIAFALLRRSRRSGSVLAASSDRKGRQ